MRNMIEALMSNSLVTGVSVAFIHNDKIEVVSQGTLDDNPITKNTVWKVASLTKPVFVYGVLQLVQQGLLDLDRPLQSYLAKPYSQTTDDLSDITARHTMTHTSGLPNWRDSDGLRLLSTPNIRFSYSSEGLNYLQYVIEHILNQSFADYLKENIFIPFGMTQSELANETINTISPSVSFILNTLPANGALSLQTTITNYARFVQKILNPSDTKHPYLNQSIYNEMLSPQVGVGSFSDLFWGLGWGLQGMGETRSFWHWGARGIPRTMNFAIGFPQYNQGVVIFTNHTDGLYLCHEIIQKLFSEANLPAFDWLLPANEWRAYGKKHDENSFDES